MAYSPDQPYPKTPGNPIMAKDWNDAVEEVKRLETAKVNRNGADLMTGPLTINGALAVGTTSAASARLHVVDSVSPAIARFQTTAVNGSARLELWSDPRGGANEWRPGYIESFDTGSFTGGLRFITNGTGFAQRLGAIEQLRLVNGFAGFGLTDPAFRIDTNGQIRVRQGTAGGGINAGIHFHQQVPNNNRAFVGMLNDSTFGLMGETGGGWSLQMDTTNGNVGIKQSPGATNALTVFGNTQLSGDAFVSGNTALGHSAPGFRLDVNGRSRFRDGNGSAGFWLFSSSAAAPQDRGLFALFNDNTLGVFGNIGSGWSFLHDLTNANTTIQGPASGANLSVGGRLSSNNFRFEVLETSLTSTTSLTFVKIGNMQLSFTLLSTKWMFFNMLLTGIELSAAAGNWTVGFRMTLDGVQIAHSEPTINVVAGAINSRHVDLTRLAQVAAGSHTLIAEWYVRSAGPTLFGSSSSGGGDRVLQAIELF